MSDLMRELRTRVDEIIRPHREVYGDEAPVVRMALRVLAEAEDIERRLGEQRVTTERASEITGWHPETLQRNAKAKLDGRPTRGWEAIDVEVGPGGGYVYLVSSLPRKPGQRVA